MGSNTVDKDDSMNHEKNRRRNMNKPRPNKKGISSSDPASETNNDALPTTQDAILLKEDESKRTPVNGLHTVNNGIENKKENTDSELNTNLEEKSNISIAIENGCTKTDINTSNLESQVNNLKIN